MKNEMNALINAECPWRDTLYWYDTVDSTNTLAKKLAAEGAPHGTVVLASRQTAGRGRLGRSFHSPAGMGIYISLLLRPLCHPEELMHLTCAAGVAACNAVENATGFRPGIKWVNDLIARGKKLGGILTELSVDSKTGLVDCAIIGIGLNCHHEAEDFPEELRSIAISLKSATGTAPSTLLLAARLIESLYEMDRQLLSDPHSIMSQYRLDCVTLGRPVTVIREDRERRGYAAGLDDRGGLIVDYPDGSRETVNSGEVSVRGIYGYTP